MNSAIAAPAATPVSSKSPARVAPVVLRPIRLTQVISVMTVISRPARIADALAKDSSIRNGVSCFSIRNQFTNP